MTMRRSPYWAFLAAFALLVGAGVYADTGRASNESRSALEQSMGEIQWGWSPKQVYRHLKRQIELSYQEPIAKTTDAIEERGSEMEKGREEVRWREGERE